MEVISLGSHFFEAQFFSQVHFYIEPIKHSHAMECQGHPAQIFLTMIE